MSVPDPVREFIRAFNERDLDAFVEVLDPEVELHSSRGLRKGREAARVWATRPPGGVQQTIELEQLYEDGLESGGGSAVALILRRWRWEEDGSQGRRRRDGLAVRAARSTGCSAGGPSTTAPRRCAPPASTRTARAYHRVDGQGCRVEQGGDRGLERAALRRLHQVPGAGHERPRRPRRGGAGGASAAARRRVHRPRLRLRRHHPAAGRAGRARGRGASGVDVAAPFIEQARKEAEGGPANVSFAVADVQVGELGDGLRLRLLADGTDVLRQPGAGAPQHPLVARAGRPALRGRLAAQGRQRLGAAGGAGRRGVPRASRGDRPADLRARARSRWPTPTRSPSS